MSLSLESSVMEVGEALLLALEKSGQTIPHPARWTGLAKQRHVAAGVKSETAFQKGAHLVSVYRDQMETRIQPTHNGGATGSNRGFHDLPNETVRIANQASSIEVGQAVFAAFVSCTHDT
jgi:hypothetical protein